MRDFRRVRRCATGPDRGRDCRRGRRRRALSDRASRVHRNVERWDRWNEVDQFIQKKYEHPSGAQLPSMAVGFDTGHKSKIVQAFVRRCRPRRVFATKGQGLSGAPWVTRSRRQAILLLKANTAKEAIYSRLNLEQTGPGLHSPSENSRPGILPSNGERKGCDQVPVRYACESLRRTWAQRSVGYHGCMPSHAGSVAARIMRNWRRNWKMNQESRNPLSPGKHVQSRQEASF